MLIKLLSLNHLWCIKVLLYTLGIRKLIRYITRSYWIYFVKWDSNKICKEMKSSNHSDSDKLPEGKQSMRGVVLGASLHSMVRKMLFGQQDHPLRNKWQDEIAIRCSRRAFQAKKEGIWSLSYKQTFWGI